MVEQDPEYLRNRSRSIHALQRRIWRWTRVSFFAWLAVVAGILAAAIIDLSFDLGWGYSREDVRVGLMVLGGGTLLWISMRLVHKILLRITRQTYGADPRSVP